jgi:hypothetical protein
MRRIELFVFLLFLAVVQLFLADQAVEGFDNNAHINLSDRAAQAQVSTLDSFLKSALGFDFPAGIEEPIFNGQNAREWIRQGAVDEDKPIFWRPRHHFHNPRLLWDQAGWRPFFIQLGESSILWSQETGQVVGGKHSWHDARYTYFQALTATSDSERKRLYGETFQSIGHLIHLVQDAAVPSHTRNDTHLSYKGFGDPDSFHGWAESDQARSMIAGANPGFLREQS